MIQKYLILTLGIVALVITLGRVTGLFNKGEDARSQESVNSEEKFFVYLTGYTYFDNTPPGADISYPTVHREAGGTGTYDDPITLAVGHSRMDGRDILDIASGTRIYIPVVRKYFVVEDTCGDGENPQLSGCHVLSTEAQAVGARYWFDLWIGGEGENESSVQA